MGVARSSLTSCMKNDSGKDHKGQVYCRGCFMMPIRAGIERVTSAVRIRFSSGLRTIYVAEPANNSNLHECVLAPKGRCETRCLAPGEVLATAWPGYAHCRWARHAHRRPLVQGRGCRSGQSRDCTVCQRGMSAYRRLVGIPMSFHPDIQVSRSDGMLGCI